MRLGPLLGDVSFVLTQDMDTCQGGDGCQELKVEFVTPDHSGHFMRLTTGKEGWSVENPAEMAKVLGMLRTAVEDVKEKYEGKRQKGKKR